MFSLVKIKQSAMLVIFQELLRGVHLTVFRLINTVLGRVRMVEIDMCFPWLIMITQSTMIVACARTA